MITGQYCTAMAQYNAWMNEKMYALCETLPDEERKRDCRAYFRSIHGTLDHILAVDAMFMAHFAKGAPTYLPEDELHHDFGELRRHRVRLDREIISWSNSVADAWLAMPSPYVHHEDGLTRTVTRGFWVVHMFNHQTHHRGQATTLLTQSGHDIGSTDIHMSVPVPDTRAI